MAYVSVLDWRPEQVNEWLKGLEGCLSSYLHGFSNNQINGNKLLNLCPDDLTHLGIYKIGHQELILEKVQQLRNFHYELDRDNVQTLALRVSCAARCLFGEIREAPDEMTVTTSIMSDVCNVISHVKPLVSWLDRAPFSGNLEYEELKPQLLRLSLKMALSAQRGRFAESPVSTIRDCSNRLAKLADSVIQDSTDPMILQPAYLDLATLKKRAGEDLGFFLVPSFYEEHLVGDLKLSSPAHQSGKIQPGDEVVQVNYQTVVGWARKKVVALIEESPNDLLLTLKRRPQHVKMYGQMYMKPYRLPSRKRAAPYSRWNENLPSPRPEFLTIPQFDLACRVTAEVKPVSLDDAVSIATSSSGSDEDLPLTRGTSPTSMRIYLPKPRAPLQRRFTLSGPPRSSAQSQQFWRELQLERTWRSNQNNSHLDGERKETHGISMREKAGAVSSASVPEAYVEKSAISDAKSIIELNKVKREAFFKNMSGLTKAVQPRGRLDKSRSTPAYDLDDTETKRTIQAACEKNAIADTESKWCAQQQNLKSDQLPIDSVELLQHGQMVNTINQTLSVDPDEDPFFSDVPPPPAPRELRPVPAQRRSVAVAGAGVVPPVPPKTKPRPLPPVPPPRLDPTQVTLKAEVSSVAPPSPGAVGISHINTISVTSASSSLTTGNSEKTKNTFDHLKAMWTLGRYTSPRATRKQNPALARTVFYFAADSSEEMQQWLDLVSLATTTKDDDQLEDSLCWSESDSDSSDTENISEGGSTTAIGLTARSNQSFTLSDGSGKFNSLKKLNNSKGGSSDVGSLDRKYLRFLTQKNRPVPVPTSQFRSYRRMQQAAPPAPPPRPPCPVPDHPPKLLRRTLHSSNPSLVNADMADYRMTQERLRELRNMRNQDRPDLSGFVTLEQFMLSRQEEERSMRPARQIRTRVYPSESYNHVERTHQEQVQSRNQNKGAKSKKLTTVRSAPHGERVDDNMAASIGQLSEVSTAPHTLPDYPGIEYPPAFEPETYTLQCIINSRRKKDGVLK